MHVKKIISISAISAAIIIGGGIVVAQITDPAYVPQAFFEQRVAGAGAAKNVARMVSDSLANLQKIEQADKASDTATALRLVSFEITNRQEKQNAASLLAGNLEQMARSTESITPAKARQLSLEAVTTGVSMVSHIINYNTNLEALFQALNIKFSGQQYTGRPVKELINLVNGEASQINDLNKKFNTLLETFDDKYVN